ncbi:MAG: hypothetical protein HY747_00065, partial [Elusimicrobia bacterium]|nr:hypothetical protein [Elusimicrobiota bacterium]
MSGRAKSLTQIAMGLCILMRAYAWGAWVPLGQVLGVEFDGHTTHLVIEIDGHLVLGETVFLRDGIPVVIGDLLSQKRNLFYYAASIPKRLDVQAGEKVYLPSSAKPGIPAEENLQTLDIPNLPKALIWRRRLRGQPFVPKDIAEITAIQHNKVLIDRGSIHEVDKRELYAVYDVSGTYKGKIETKGVGDFQSTADFYHSLEDGNKNFHPALGDKAVYLGQRKVISLGLMFAWSKHSFAHGFLSSKSKNDLRNFSRGGGLLWEINFRDGLTAQWLLGFYNELVFFAKDIEKSSKLFAPLALKKVFFYPSPLAPYVRIGLTNFSERLKYLNTETKRTGLAPLLGGGLELFAGRTIHIYGGMDYFFLPDLRSAIGTTYRTRKLYYTGGFAL